MLVEVGITTPEMLRRISPEEAYRRLRFHRGKRVTINFIYALDVAVAGGRWGEDEGRQAQLRARAKAIQAEIDPPSPLRWKR
jgi:hypothetical protein